MAIFYGADNNHHGKRVAVEITAEDSDETPYLSIHLDGEGLAPVDIVVETREDADVFLAAVAAAHREFFEMLDAEKEAGE